MNNDFTAYLQSINLSKSTQIAYNRNASLFTTWYKKPVINCTKKDVLKYLEYLQNQKLQENITRRNALIAINHYFTFLVKNEQVIINPTALIKIRGTHKQQLYRTYTAEELQTIYDNFYTVYVQNYDDSHIPKNQRTQCFLSRQRNFIMLGFLINQGLATNELQKLHITDIDLNKGTIKVTGGKKSNERKLPLHPAQTGALIHYINNIRPQFFTYCNESDKLFFTLPESSKQKTATINLMHVFKPLTKQVKDLDANFLNFKQVRASVITTWLKTQGLRKAQYLAGHKYISTTERYLPNEITGLIDDISKFNPF